MRSHFQIILSLISLIGACIAQPFDENVVYSVSTYPGFPSATSTLFLARYSGTTYLGDTQLSTTVQGRIREIHQDVTTSQGNISALLVDRPSGLPQIISVVNPFDGLAQPVQAPTVIANSPSGVPIDDFAIDRSGAVAGADSVVMVGVDASNNIIVQRLGPANQPGISIGTSTGGRYNVAVDPVSGEIWVVSRAGILHRVPANFGAPIGPTIINLGGLIVYDVEDISYNATANAAAPLMVACKLASTTSSAYCRVDNNGTVVFNLPISSTNLLSSSTDQLGRIIGLHDTYAPSAGLYPLNRLDTTNTLTAFTTTPTNMASPPTNSLAMAVAWISMTSWSTTSLGPNPLPAATIAPRPDVGATIAISDAGILPLPPGAPIWSLFVSDAILPVGIPLGGGNTLEVDISSPLFFSITGVAPPWAFFVSPAFAGAEFYLQYGWVDSATGALALSSTTYFTVGLARAAASE